MKNAELLQNAIGIIGDDLISDADRKPARLRVIRWSAVACACLAVVCVCSVMFFNRTPPQQVYYNSITEYGTAGNRLVNPVIVTKEEFLSVYPIDVEALMNGNEGDLHYRFDCAMDSDTLETDRSTVVNGVIHVIKNAKVVQTFCIARDEAIIEYVFDRTHIQTSNIDGVEVELYDIVDKGGKSRLYAILKLDEYHITYTITEGTQFRMITMLEKLIASYTSEEKS